MIDALLKSGTCALLVSEEQEEPIVVPEHLRGTLCCAFDPLDGSSNIDCNVSTGTIFSVFKKTSEVAPLFFFTFSFLYLYFNTYFAHIYIFICRASPRLLIF